MKRIILLSTIMAASINVRPVQAQVLVFDNPDKNAVSAFLTPEDQRSSNPIPFTLGASGAPIKAPAANGPMVVVPPTLPNPNAIEQAKRDFPEQWEKLQSAGVQASQAAQTLVDCQVDLPDKGIIDQRLHPCTSYLGNRALSQVLQYPWRTIGKLFMTDANGSKFHGTAQIISTTGDKTLIITAAHNIWDDNTKALTPKITFVPGERDGVAAYGQFDYEQAFLLSAYTDHPDATNRSRYDVALLTLKPNSAGKQAATYTGTLGLKWNVPYVMSVYQFGYTGDGIYTTISIGQTFKKTFTETQNCVPKPTNEILFSGSTLSKGASGGAWIESFRPHYDKNGNHVVSVVSGGVLCVINGNPINIGSIITGPQFADDNVGALCAKAGCTNASSGAP